MKGHVRLPHSLALTLLLGCAVPLAATIAPRAAQAQPAKKPPPGKEPAKDPKLAEAKKLFEAASIAYDEGRFEDAIKAWEKSYELSGKALIFESISKAYERAGDKKKAREYLAKWRAEAPEAEHEQLDVRIKNLDARIAAADAAEAASKGDDAKKKADKLAAEKAAKEEAKAQEQARSQRLVLAIGIGGAGVLAVGAGVVLDVVASGQRPDPKTACAPAGDKTFCKASAKDGIEGSSTLALAGDITWISGAALAALGATLLFTLPDAPAAGARETVNDGPKEAPKDAPKQGRASRRWVSIGPLVNASGGGVGVSGAF